MQDLYAMPGHLIRRVQQISSAIFAEECAAFDLTSVQFAAMVAISGNPRVDATRLSQLIAFDRSTIGGVLDRLEGKGWIKRSPSSDRRIKLIELTDAGAGLLREVEPSVKRVQERLMGPLAPEDRTTMLRLLGPAWRATQLWAVSNAPRLEGQFERDEFLDARAVFTDIDVEVAPPILIVSTRKGGEAAVPGNGRAVSGQGEPFRLPGRIGDPHAATFSSAGLATRPRPGRVFRISSSLSWFRSIVDPCRHPKG